MKYWKTWVFVLGLNIVAIFGAIYIQSIGIDHYEFRGSK